MGFPAFIREVKGAMSTDVEGNCFVDFAGVGTINVGHFEERVLRAAREQLGCLVHTDYAVTPYGIYAGVAERLGLWSYSHSASGPMSPALSQHKVTP